MLHNIVSVILYWLGLGITLVLCEKFRKRNLKYKGEIWLWVLAVSMPLALVAGMRGLVGTDYLNYVKIYRQVEELSFLECLTHDYLDIAFITVLKLVLILTPDDKSVFFIVALLSIAIPFAAIMKHKDRFHVTLFVLFYYLILYHPSLNVTRQCLAAGLLLWSVILLLDKKYIACAIVSVINVLTHNTTVLMAAYVVVVLYINWACKGSKENRNLRNPKLSLYYAGIAISPLLIPGALKLLLMIPVFQGYSKYIIQDAKAGVGQIVYFAALIGPMLLYRKMIFRKGWLFRLFNLSLLYFPIAYMGYYFDYASRMNMYSFMVIVLLVCRIVSIRRKDPKVWIFAGWYVLIFGYFYVSDILMNNYHETLPYII